MEYIKRLTLPIDKPYTASQISAKQGDYNSRFVVVNLSVDGKVLSAREIGDVSMAAIGVRRADKQSKTFEAVYNKDGTFTLPLPSFATERANDTVKIDLMIWTKKQIARADNNLNGEAEEGNTASCVTQLIRSFCFTIYVESAGSTDEDIRKDKTTDVLTNLLNAVAQLETEVEVLAGELAEAEAARVSAELNRAEAETAREIAELTRVKAEQQRELSEDTREENEQERITAEAERRAGYTEIIALVEQEEIRAKEAETANAEAIAKETERASKKETELHDMIAALSKNFFIISDSEPDIDGPYIWFDTSVENISVENEIIMLNLGGEENDVGAEVYAEIEGMSYPVINAALEDTTGNDVTVIIDNEANN